MKIIVFEPNYLGDVLMTAPALRLLRSGLKDAAILAVVNTNLKDALNGFVDGFIERPAKMKFGDRISLLAKVRKQKPDIAVLFRTTFTNAALAFFSGARARAGVNTEFVSPFLTKTFKRGNPRLPFYSEYIELSRLVGAAGQTENNLKVNIPEDAGIFADSILKENAAGNTVIVISPGSSRPAKMWSAENYAGMIDRFGPDVKIFLTGTMPEENLIENIKNSCRKNTPISLAGKTSVLQLAALLSRSSLFIGPDSGALYLAAAAGTPLIGLFGSTDPALYGPFSEGDVIIYKKEPCGPCYKNECDRPSFCMDKITVDEVFQSAGRILGKNGK